MAAPRRFDHDECRSRQQAGERIVDLAREYGVTANRIDQIVHDRTDYLAAYNRRWRQGTCEICRGPAMRLVGTKKIRMVDGRVLCARCRNDERRERIRFDPSGAIEAVKCMIRDCAHGDRWQPLANFTRGVRHRELIEGGISTTCRACQTRDRRAYRDARKVPCSHGCGTLVLHERRDPTKPPECRPCSRARIKASRLLPGEDAQAHRELGS